MAHDPAELVQPQVKPNLIHGSSCLVGRSFAAIDFETANTSRASACAVAVVFVRDGDIFSTFERRIRPPTREFTFTHVHRLCWSDVEHAPSFASVWRELQPLLVGVEFMAAHNARFDESVLSACCSAAGLPVPRLPFVCTLQLARAVWGFSPARLPDVCGHLGIHLAHHDRLSDAEACARIVLAAGGAAPGPILTDETR